MLISVSVQCLSSAQKGWFLSVSASRSCLSGHITRLHFFSTSTIRFRKGDGSFRDDDSRRRKETTKPSNDLLELADINFGNPLVQPPPAPTRTSASALSGDPWGMVEAPVNDPWGAPAPAAAHQPEAHDPWSPVQQQPPRASPLAHPGGLGSPGSVGNGLYPALGEPT